MRIHVAAVALLASFVLVSCNRKHAEGEATATAGSSGNAGSGSAAPAAAPADGRIAAPDPNRKVIRTGRIELVVATYDDARGKLDKLLEAAGGYVDSTQVQHYQGAVSSATLVLRIPHDAFGRLLPRLKELGQVEAESTNAEDVTDKFVDVSARLASAQTLEKRLLEIAADRAAGVEALLAVERELARVRGEIESYEGRLRQWSDQVAMSTLTLTLRTNAPALVEAEPSLGSQIAKGFSESVSALRSFGVFIVVTGSAVLPWLLLFVPAFVFGRRAYRRLGRAAK